MQTIEWKRCLREFLAQQLPEFAVAFAIIPVGSRIPLWSGTGSMSQMIRGSLLRRFARTVFQGTRVTNESFLS